MNLEYFAIDSQVLDAASVACRFEYSVLISVVIFMVLVFHLVQYCNLNKNMKLESYINLD